MAESEGPPGNHSETKTIINAFKLWFSHKTPMRDSVKSDIVINQSPSAPPLCFPAKKRPVLDSYSNLPRRRRLGRDAALSSMRKRSLNQGPNEASTSSQLLSEFDAPKPSPSQLAKPPNRSSTLRQQQKPQRQKTRSIARRVISPGRVVARPTISPPRHSTMAVRETHRPSFLQSVAEPQPSQPQPKPTHQHSPDELKELKRWIRFYQSLGYDQEHVIKALIATSMSTGGAAAEAMECLKQGNSLPTNMEGVWTDRDDEMLRMINSTDVNKTPADGQVTKRMENTKKDVLRLKYKHGDELVALRTQFLAALDALQFETPRGTLLHESMSDSQTLTCHAV